MEHIEDSALIAQILDGDRKAFAVLVQRYSRYVYAQIARSVRLVDDVEDLVQIVFIKVYENLHQLRKPDRFRPWLHSIVRNAVNSIIAVEPCNCDWKKHFIQNLQRTQKKKSNTLYEPRYASYRLNIAR